MKNYTINAHYVKNDADSMGHKFPLNTYETDSPEKVLDCIRGWLYNNESGINKVVVLNHKMDKERLKEADVGQAPMNLDDYRECDDCGIKTTDLITKGDHHGGMKTVCRDRNACHARGG